MACCCALVGWLVRCYRCGARHSIPGILCFGKEYHANFSRKYQKVLQRKWPLEMFLKCIEDQRAPNGYGESNGKRMQDLKFKL